jgi:hypothetical protein
MYISKSQVAGKRRLEEFLVLTKKTCIEVNDTGLHQVDVNGIEVKWVLLVEPIEGFKYIKKHTLSIESSYGTSEKVFENEGRYFNPWRIKKLILEMVVNLMVPPGVKHHKLSEVDLLEIETEKEKLKVLRGKKVEKKEKKEKK